MEDSNIEPKNLVASSGLAFVGPLDAQAKLFDAVARARPKFKNVVKDTPGQIGNVSFRYADLATLVASAEETLASEGVAVMQFLTGDAQTLILTTVFAGHGAQIRSELCSARPPDVKEFGRVTTYLRRYAYQAGFVLDGDRDADSDHVQPQLAQQKRREPPPSPILQTTIAPIKQTVTVREPVDEGIPRATQDQLHELRALRTGLKMSQVQVTELIAARYQVTPQSLQQTQAADLIGYLGGLKDLGAQGNAS